MADEVGPTEQGTAYHEAGHAVLAHHLFGSGAIAELTITPDEDYLGAMTRSPEYQELRKKLITYAEGGIAGVLMEAWNEGDPTYDGWDDDQVDEEGPRLYHLCDLLISVCIAGHVAEELFSGTPNQTTEDSDWREAKDLAASLMRCEHTTEGADCSGYFDVAWGVTKHIMREKYVAAIFALVGQLLEKKTLTGAEVAETIESNLLLLSNT
jgi:hypothetical protein